MTILNRENDGLPSVLITLAGIVAHQKEIDREDLLKICVPHEHSDRDGGQRKALSSRASGTLARWTSLGLFKLVGEKVQLATELRRGESQESFLDRLPVLCRRLVLNTSHATPLWSKDGRVSEEGVGLTADFCRSLAWCLSQDVYMLPNSYGELETLITEQLKPGRFVFLNDTRWPGLRDWARFLGFATGDDNGFFFDVTEAVRSELAELMNPGEAIPAAEFVERLSNRLPILDGGSYRIELEESLRSEKWAPPPEGYLSTSLSFALRRLQKTGYLTFSTLADADSRVTLSRLGGGAWDSFTHVNLSGKLQ